MVWTCTRPPTPTGTPLDTTGYTLALEEATGLWDRAFAEAAGLRDQAFTSIRQANENDGENEPAGRPRQPVNITAARARRCAGPERRSVIWGPTENTSLRILL